MNEIKMKAQKTRNELKVSDSKTLKAEEKNLGRNQPQTETQVRIRDP